jgi:2',3'-cyclic-nucleotide 2'-phosphodiesterase (5'-nucleotidase family)
VLKRMRHLCALLLSLSLMLSLAAGAGAATDGTKGSPPLWTATGTYDWYTALTAETVRTAGTPVTETHAFTVKANVARLTVENHGVRNLDVAINGQPFKLDSFFVKGEGTASFDVSSFVQYGVNSIDIESLGAPDTSAKLTVEAPAFDARLLHINDIHAKVDPLPKVAAYVKAAKAQGGNVYFINAGDNFSGNPVSDLNQGVPMIEALNAMGTDLNVVGNHDFDHGPANTQARREESQFPWLSANTRVVDQTATPIQPFEPYKIITNELGQKIAFIGLTETPPSTGRKNIVGLAFDSPVAVAQRYITELRDQVNVVVVVSHDGFDFDQAMAPQITGADLIIGAHSHTYLDQPVVVNGIPIVQVGSDAKYVGDLNVRQAEAVAVTAAGPAGAYTVDTAKLTTADPDVQAIVDKWNAAMGPILNAPIGYTPIELNRDDRYTRDVSIGNLITDGMRDYFDADIALTNNGGIRASIPAGDINMQKIYTVLPFGNFIQKFTLTGDQVRQLIDFSYSRRNQLDLQTSGLTYTILTKPDGSIDQLDLKVNGQPIDPNAEYTLAVADYIGTGGSGYPLAGFGAPTDISSEVDAVVVGEYVKKVGNLTYKATDGRIKVKAAPVPTAVAKVNFYNSSSLLAAAADGSLTALTNQATVLVTGEATAYQFERSATAPKNFAKVDAGKPIPLAAMQQVGNGKVVGMGALLVANGFKAGYQNGQWMTNLLDSLTGAQTGSVLIDEGHGQFYDNTKFGQLSDFLADRGWSVGFTGKATRLTATMLAGVKVLMITTPGSVGAYTADELTVLNAFVAGGGNVILASQTDFGNNSNPVELNSIAAGIGTAIRFNSDEVRDNTSNDGGANYSPVTTQFNPGYPDLLKVR